MSFHSQVSSTSSDYVPLRTQAAVPNSTSYEQKRTIHDDKRMNHYDRLQLKMQKERTRINSAPTVKKYEDKGSIQHEPQVSTTKKLNFHTYSLNHSVVPRCDKI